MLQQKQTLYTSCKGMVVREMMQKGLQTSTNKIVQDVIKTFDNQ
jgi:hypothetical protein